jgi:hypothetical protein
MSNFMKIRSAVLELLYVDRRTDMSKQTGVLLQILVANTCTKTGFSNIKHLGVFPASLGVAILELNPLFP